MAEGLAGIEAGASTQKPERERASKDQNPGTGINAAVKQVSWE